jgi:hypothetical protein
MKKLLAIGIIIISLTSCRKDATEAAFALPQTTQTGQNTFGFLLNTSVWTNYGQVCFPFAGGCRDNLSGIFYKNDGDILINTDRVIYKNGNLVSSESIEIYLRTKFSGVRTYSTLTNDTISIAYFYNKRSSPDSMYVLPKTNPGFRVKITKLDTVSNIMSGEFSGTVFKRIDYTNFATSLTDSININDGRFDIKLK